MVFLNRNAITHKQHLFTVVGSIIAVTTTLASSGAATQLAFATGVQQCANCGIIGRGSGTVECTDNTIYTSTISFSATKTKGTVSGSLTITAKNGTLTSTGTITGGKISPSKYSLQGTWDSSGICGTSGTTASFSVSGPTGTSVPINFQSGAIASSSFTGTVIQNSTR
jgi:hypothetical protein